MDTPCKICGEPWYAWGVRNGDMEQWEADLFLQGKGCPCCTPIGWDKPEPKIVEDCTCAGCGVSVAVEPEQHDYVWYGGESVHYYRGYSYTYGENHRHEPAHKYADPKAWVKVDGEPYCPGCVQECADCGVAPVFTGASVQAEDPYEVGASFPNPSSPYYGVAVCVDCYEQSPEEECV